MYSWSKDFPTLTELFFGKEEAAVMYNKDTESIVEGVEDTNRIIEDTTGIERGIYDSEN